MWSDAPLPLPPVPLPLPLPRRALLAATVVAMASLAACQVAPLYGTGPNATPPGTVAVAPVTTRVAQQVRNALIEDLGRPTAKDPFRLTLRVTTNEASFLRSEQLQRPTRGSVTVVAAYTLKDGDAVIANGTERGSAQFDAPIQLFARQRAVRDAENRAARLAAQRVRLAIAPTLSRGRDPLSVVGADVPAPERDPE